MAIGNIFRAHRVIKGMTQEKLAEQSDVSVNFISEVERGITVPKITSIMKLAVGLDINFHVLSTEIKDAIFSSVKADVLKNRNK